MHITFGLSLDTPAYPTPDSSKTNHLQVGPTGMLHLLERVCGQGGHEENTDHLRIEHYRQALLRHLETRPDCFFGDSFLADQFGTTEELLSRRDELLLGGWNFEVVDELPPRLRALAEIEQYLCGPDCETALEAGTADRLIAILNCIGQRRHGIERIELVEPLELLPAPWPRLFAAIGVPVVERAQPAPPTEATTDLHRWQQTVLEIGEKSEARPPAVDGSLLLLRAPRAVDAAAYIARLLRLNPDFRPLVLLPEKNRTLDEALIQQGLPSLGIESPSLARPSLQILKLVSAFLWEPIDPFKILEFLSLYLKPLDDGIAKIVGRRMAETPGMDLYNWQREIEEYLADPVRSREVNAATAMRQFKFWFDRERYDVQGKVPKSEVIKIFDYLFRWARNESDRANGGSLVTLASQTRRIRDLLYELPENELSQLELERVVRTIYEPSPIVVAPPQMGHLPYVHRNSAMLEPVADLLWWNFGQHEPDHFFSRWYQDELAFFEKNSIRSDTPQRRNELLLWSRKQPVARCRERMILVIPERVDGTDMNAHPLYADLEACFGEPDAITFNLRKRTDEVPRQYLALPGFEILERREHQAPQPILQNPRLAALPPRESESYSSLDSLIYYPHQWVFRYLLKLNGSSLLSVSDENRMKGNIAHRVFEKLLENDWAAMSEQEVRQFVWDESLRRLRREGATLLMYGREPDRIGFQLTLQQSAITLLNSLKTNKWEVVGTEQRLEDELFGTPITGIADLILRRGDEYCILDLKWRGVSYRRNQLQSEEDLQLVLYSRMHNGDTNWPHTAFFIISDARLIARNNLAFQEAEAVAGDVDHREVNQRILDKIARTIAWRRSQIAGGQLEIRTEHSSGHLDDIYNDDYPDLLMNLLEMKQESSRFDDYGVLVSVVG